jgi:hypothetical protein
VSPDDLAALACSLLIHAALSNALPWYETYEVAAGAGAWFDANAYRLDPVDAARLRSEKPGTRFFVSGRYYEKDAECWVVRMAGRAAWIDVFVDREGVRRAR